MANKAAVKAKLAKAKKAGKKASSVNPEDAIITEIGILIAKHKEDGNKKKFVTAMRKLLDDYASAD